MRLPFVKTKNGDNDYGDECSGEDHPAIETKSSEKGGNILLKIALCSGVFFVLLAAVGGYYYLNYTRGSLNKRISSNPSGLVKAIDLGGGENASTSREEPFIEGPSNKAGPGSLTKPSNEPARQASLAGASPGAQVTSKAPLRKVSVPSGMVPPPAEKTSRDGMASKPPVSSDQPETLLSNLVLRDDNPFRDKFLKRFQESQAPKMSLKDKRRSARSGEVSRSSRSGVAGKGGSGLAGGELAILPDIAGGGDRPGDLKVVGVIQTKDAAIALTNKGELKVGSVVDGDAVTVITMNEVRLKSGKALKVTAQ